MTNLEVFNFNSNEVRVVLIDNEPWWVAIDVCLSLEIVNCSDVIGRLDDDEVDLTDLTDRLGRKQRTRVINEAGLYNLIFKSDKPVAKEKLDSDDLN